MILMDLVYLAPVLAKFKLTDNPLLLVLAVLGPFVVAIIAAAKGRSAMGWFFYGAILWPIAFIHVITIEPNRDRTERRQLRRGKATRCPYCAELVRPEARVCKHCQRDLPAGTGRLSRRRG